MIGLLILAYEGVGNGLVEAASHVLGKRPPRLEALSLNYNETPEYLAVTIRQKISSLDDGAGVIILSDIYGASHTNAACRLLDSGHIELIAGLNLPMLIRIINYRHLPINDVMEKAMTGGCGGIFHPCVPAKPNGTPA